jgi:NADH:ubiquinone oxidoreductase subunit 5 (subunit L)/multisubunit Na+/H+ antiporter MnhA subunit
MWVPLAVLAVLAVVGGLVGIGPAFTGGGELGGRLNIVTWLDPIIWNAQTRGFGKESAEESAVEQGHGRTAEGSPLPTESSPGARPVVTRKTIEESGAPYGDTGFNLARAIEKAGLKHRYTEWIFIVISLLAAGTGMGLGWLFYIKDTSLPDIWATRLRPLYKASYNKYWVDEFYGWAVTRRTMDLARGVYAFDSKVVDGAVNGTAWLTRISSRVTGWTDKYFVDGLVNTIANFVIRLVSPLLRAAQTGLAQNYALVMVLGLLIAVAILFWNSVFLK